MPLKITGNMNLKIGLGYAVIIFILMPLNLRAENPDLNFNLEQFDPFANDALSDENDEQLDKLKSADQLITEADYLIEDQRPLDARTKLFRALKKDPKNYRAYILLSGYYLIHVGHFKLSLRYIRQAENIFYQQRGHPPYADKRTQLEHGQILYLLSQARLNLDDYQGALDVLEKFKSLSYNATWFPGTKAWILMKLGRIDEAIKTARLGVLEGAEPGRTLNMLGILLSMSGQRNESLAVFKEAIAYELSLGNLGQPATPLNNSGEVYKEMFEDERAESNWLRAASMPDGCEHFLPTLNLSLLYFEQLNIIGVKRAIQTFQSCFAQYPLKNGEEHKALLSFTNGKVMYYLGHPDLAINLFKDALKSRQWFGKIGTSQDDLEVATLSALSKAHKASANRINFKVSNSYFEAISNLQESIYHNFCYWWYERKARRKLIESMNEIEDLTIRNTDSMLEYPTLGTLLKGLNTKNLITRIEEEKKSDNRAESEKFYQTYLAENLLHHGKIKEAIAIIDQVLPLTREKFDLLLKIHLLALRIRHLPEDSQDYRNLAWTLFKLNRIVFRNYGIKLPVTVENLKPKDAKLLVKSGFLPITEKSDFTLNLTTNNINQRSEFVTELNLPIAGRMKLSSEKLTDLLNRLNETLFSEDL